MKAFSLAFVLALTTLAAGSAQAGGWKNTKCVLSIPRGGEIKGGDMIEGLGNGAAAAKKAAVDECKNRYEATAPGACDEAAKDSFNFPCQIGLYKSF